jgi:hypothetical protein
MIILNELVKLIALIFETVRFFLIKINNYVFFNYFNMHS